MAFSLGLALYRLTAARGNGRRDLPGPRPAGRLAWLHSPSAESRLALVELARKLHDDSGVTVLLTALGPAPESAPIAPDDGLVTTLPPQDIPGDIRVFLDHWRPEIAVMAEGELRPLLLEELARRRIPCLLVEGLAPRLADRRRAWFPGVMSQALDRFAAILVRDAAAAQAFVKARAPSDRLRITGPMEEPSSALDCNESDRVALAGAMATRPVWLAIDVPAAEEPMVFAAHHEALKLAHRLILILAPDDPTRIPALAARLEADESWQIASRLADQEPAPEVEVFLVEAGTEAGLWYRLAPVVYIGGGLSQGGCRRDPMEAAALGSSMILGTREGRWGRAYARLTRARAARLVASPADLNLALSDLLSPDRAARQAHAAWTLASEGSEATADVVAMIAALMDGEPLPGALLLSAPASAPAPGDGTQN
jgi:3-deoxy-D-manno-octulosonic-acid transferase